MTSLVDCPARTDLFIHAQTLSESTNPVSNSLQSSPVTHFVATDTIPTRWTLILKTNPFATIQGQIPGAGETFILQEQVTSKMESISLGIGISWLTPWGRTLWENLLNMNQPSATVIQVFQGAGLRGMIAYRYYLSQRAPHGIYFTAIVNGHIFRLSIEYLNVRYPVTLEVLNGILGIGWQTITSTGFGLDIVGGFNYRKWWLTVSDPTTRARQRAPINLPTYWIWLTFYLSWGMRP